MKKLLVALLALLILVSPVSAGKLTPVVPWDAQIDVKMFRPIQKDELRFNFNVGIGVAYRGPSDRLFLECTPGVGATFSQVLSGKQGLQFIYATVIREVVGQPLLSCTVTDGFVSDTDQIWRVVTALLSQDYDQLALCVPLT